MANSHNISPGLADLGSQEQNDLMDAIDELRPLSLQHELDIPQLIVCGKQSAGKSSVLEAISGVAFPTGYNTVTTFATELVLKKCGTESMAASLVLAQNTSAAVRETLLPFCPQFDRLDDFQRVLQETNDHLKRLPYVGTFSRHRLRIEISGPRQPHLTLIDMPGLIANVTHDSPESDIDDAKAIVKDYMSQANSIILAVMPATGDIMDQEVFHLASEADPERVRTLGILTMPDRVEAGNVEHYITLIQNHKIPLALGWHTLKNLGPAAPNRSPSIRDDEEAAFFADQQSQWSTLPPADRGVAALRTKLRGILFHSITSTLPVLQRAIESEIDTCEDRVKHLGPPRTSRNDYSLYLGKVATKLATAIDHASSGDYDRLGFEPLPTNSGSTRLLRTRIADHCDNFERAMTQGGQLFHVVDSDMETCELHGRPVCGSDFRLSQTSQLPQCVGYLTTTNAIINRMQELKGPELAGEYSPYIIGQVFKLMASPWERLAHDLTNRCLDAAQRFLTLALDNCAGSSHTARAIQEHVLTARFDECRSTVRVKVKELVSPFQSLSPKTKNPQYLNSRKVRDAQAMEEDFRRNGLPQDAQSAERVRYPGQRVLNAVLSYYEVASCTFIDNIVTLAVENCIVEPLKSFFTVDTIHQLDDDRLDAIAGEPTTVVQNRNQTVHNLEVLRKVRGVCNQHVYWRGDAALRSVTASPTQWPQDEARTANSDLDLQTSRGEDVEKDKVVSFSRNDPAMRTPPRTPENGPTAQDFASRNRVSSRPVASHGPLSSPTPSGDQLSPPLFAFGAQGVTN